MRTILAAITMIAALAMPPAAQAQIINGPPGDDMLTPEIMAAEPRLTEMDIALFADLFNGILTGAGEQSDIVTFARIHGVTMIRLNYATVKIAFAYASESSRESLVRELGLGILMNAEEKALLDKKRAEIDPIMRVFQEDSGL